MPILIPQRVLARPLHGNAEVDGGHPCARRLEACYLFGNTASLLPDIGPYARQSTTITGATRAVSGASGPRGQPLQGHVYDFPASTDRIAVGTWGFDMSDGVTVEAWVWNDTFPNRDVRYVSKADGTGTANHDWMIGYTASGASRNFRCRAARSDNTAVGATDHAASTNQWIHVLGRGLPDVPFVNLTIWVNGVQDGAATGNTPAYGATANAIELGNHPANNLAPDGKIGLVTVWSRALSDDEIRWRYNEPWAFLRPIVRRTYFDLIAAGGGPTLFEQALAGALASAGGLARRTDRSLAGAAVSAGALVRDTARPLAGAVASSGTLTQQVARELAGAVASAGALTAIKTALLSIAGTLTSSGAISRHTDKVVAGTATSSGAISQQVARAVNGVLATAGALVKQTQRALTGGLTTAGALTTIKAALLSVTGTLTSSGALTTQAVKTLAGVLSSSSTVQRLVGAPLTATLLLSGTIGKQTTRAFVGVLSWLGQLVSVVVTGTLTPTIIEFPATSGAVISFDATSGATLSCQATTGAVIDLPATL